MIKDDGSVGTDALDLEIGGNRIRVLSEDPAASSTLRCALADHVVDEPAPPGFVLKKPERGSRLHLLLDRSGFVLGRARTSEECLAMLDGHLSALLQPPPGTVRLRMRALLEDDSSALLACFPLLTDPPLVERQLERHSYRIIDRLVVDLAPDGCIELPPSPWSGLSEMPSASGHVGSTIDQPRVGGVLVPKFTNDDPTVAMIVAMIAGAVTSRSTHVERVKVAERLAGLPTSAAVINDGRAVYKSIRRLSSTREHILRQGNTEAKPEER